MGYHWKSASWIHICGYICRVQSDVLKSGKSRMQSIAFLYIIIMEARDCYIPSTVAVVAQPNHVVESLLSVHL